MAASKRPIDCESRWWSRCSDRSTGARIPPVPVAGRRESARRVGNDLHRPQPPEAVHPRKGGLSRLLCNKSPATIAYLDGLLGNSIRQNPPTPGWKRLIVIRPAILTP